MLGYRWSRKNFISAYEIMGGHRETAGLPANIEAEQFVLASILVNDSNLDLAIATLEPNDFSLNRHRLIFRRMIDVRGNDQKIDRVTVANELLHYGELEAGGGLGYLASLDDGMPPVLNLDSYIKIVKEKSNLRQLIIASDRVIKRAMGNRSKAETIITEHLQDLGRIRQSVETHHIIRSVDDLESVFASADPINYLVKPELPAGSVVYLAGDSESGKSTLACAWARDLIGRGHGVLLLDRDHNPRERIRDRFVRLGITCDHRLLRVWDAQQNADVPQPDSPLVLDWVVRTIKDTGRPPLVIADSLISFFRDNEDENCSTDMRAFFERCRAPATLGACVVVIHHLGKDGRTRGSSDFRAAADQGFTLRNCNPDGARLLSRLMLRVDKSRYGLTHEIIYNYAAGKMVRESDPHVVSKTVTEQLMALLQSHPGVNKTEFEELAIRAKLGRRRGRDFLDLGAREGTIRCKQQGRAGHYFAAGDALPGDDQQALSGT